MLLLAGSVLAQNDTVTVPDVTGLNLPQATARLNANGLQVGEQMIQPGTAATGIPGSVVAQSLAAGEQTGTGTPVNLTILSAARVQLIYDDNDLTMLNDTGTTVNLANMVFGSADGTKRFPASRWRSTLEAGDCTQIWSIARREPKPVNGCDSVYWLTTNNPANHFWTQTAGVQQFTVVHEGVQVTCEAAPPGSQNNPSTCEFYILADTTDALSTSFVYFAYTRDMFAVINTTSDRWMPLDDTPLYNFNPGLQNPGGSLLLSDDSLFPNPPAVGTVERLAPGQCLLLTLDSATATTPPPECETVIAERALSSQVAFWLADFELDSPFAGQDRVTCPAARETRQTVCVMPR
jgi:hypothetical protein